VRRWLEQILAAALWLGVWVVAVHAQTAASRADRPFSVTHYDVQLEPRLDSRTVTGTVTLSVVVQRDNVDTIALDRGRLEIDAVEENGQSRAFVLDGNRMRITLPRGRVNQPRSVTVRYRGAPSSGLLFSAEREQIYTVSSTSQWMIALDDPSARATLRLRVTMPRACSARRAVARCRAVSCQKTRSSWNGSRIGLCQPTPSAS